MGKPIRNHTGDVLKIWQGGFFSYTENHLDAIKEFVIKFQQRNDTKAEMAVFFTFTSGQVSSVSSVTLLIQTDTIDSSRLL
jgi:hypothetical protein